MRRENGASLGFERELWSTADALRSTMDAAEYKHVVLSLLFLRHLTDPRASLRRYSLPGGADWGKVVSIQDDRNVLAALRNLCDRLSLADPQVGGMLSIDRAFDDLQPKTLSALVRAVDSIPIRSAGSASLDLFGRVYEYFLGQFAKAEGQRGGQYYTPWCVVELLVAILQPLEGAVYDPCCGSGGMFVQSGRFVAAHGARRTRISIYGQESNPKTWRLAQMNLALHEMDGNLGEAPADTFSNDLHPDLRANYILANPPFNQAGWTWKGYEEDLRWWAGVPPRTNANYAWIQHFCSKLASGGRAGFVLANGSLSSVQAAELKPRQRLVDEDWVECIVTLPSHLFYSTPISASLWFLTKNKRESAPHVSGKILVMDARSMGEMATRIHRELGPSEIDRIAAKFHQWRQGDHEYRDEDGFCRSVSVEEIRDHRYALVPGRYVGFAPQESMSKERILARLGAESADLRERMAETERALSALHVQMQAKTNG